MTLVNNIMGNAKEAEQNGIVTTTGMDRNVSKVWTMLIYQYFLN